MCVISGIKISDSLGREVGDERDQPKDAALISEVPAGVGGGATAGEREQEGRGSPPWTGCGIPEAPEGCPGGNDRPQLGIGSAPEGTGHGWGSDLQTTAPRGAAAPWERAKADEGTGERNLGKMGV